MGQVFSGHQCHIEKLPPELISYIFQLGFDDLFRPPAYELIISWVCRRWRAIALRQPAFWGTLILHEDWTLARAQTYLERALTINAPLMVNLWYIRPSGRPMPRMIRLSTHLSHLKNNLTKMMVANFNDEQEDEQAIPEEEHEQKQFLTLEMALSLLVPHTDHWKSFACTVVHRQHMELILSELYQCPRAPSLELLDLCYDWYPTPGTDLPILKVHPRARRGAVIFNGDAPKLKNVTLKSINLSWRDYQILHGLTNFTVVFMAQPVEPSAQYPDFISILRGSPELFNVEVKRLPVSHSFSTQELQAGGPINLHWLTTLKLYLDLDPAQWGALFASLSVPNLVSLQIGPRGKQSLHFSAVLNELCDSHPLTHVPVLSQIQYLGLRRVDCNIAILERAYRTMRSLQSLDLIYVRLAVFLEPLMKSYEDTRDDQLSTVPCPRLSYVSLSGDDLAELADQLEKRRREMGLPLYCTTVVHT